MLFSRFTSFIQSLLKSEKPSVHLLLAKVCNYVNTITGWNIGYILAESKCQDFFKINPKKLKKEFRFCPTKKEDNWKTGFVKELVDLKNTNHDVKDDFELSVDEIDKIIEYLTTC